MPLDDIGVKQPRSEPVYLGDAVYATYDGYHIKLYTHNGIRELDKIFLEPAVFDNLIKYKESLTK